MRLLHKILLNIFVFSVLLILFYLYQINYTKQATIIISSSNSSTIKEDIGNALQSYEFKFQGKEFSGMVLDNQTQDEYNIWCIFTKVSSNIQMKHKFRRFFMSLLQHSSVLISLHLIIDGPSKIHAKEVLSSIRTHINKTFEENYYEVNDLAVKLQDIVSSMQPYFSSQPGSYYSDALFYLSLGLHRVASEQKTAIMFDADTKVLTDVSLLFKEFKKFGPETLFGLAPELSPVYHHILYIYRSKYKDTMFGRPMGEGGFPGLNSGVIMFQFEHIRKSKKYSELLKPEAVQQLVKKYDFKGHLGDQDFYSLLGMDYPSMIHVLDCEWNRQLCTWWKSHGYQDIFDDFFRCEKKISVYHGNCNTAIPNSSL